MPPARPTPTRGPRSAGSGPATPPSSPGRGRLRARPAERPPRLSRLLRPHGRPQPPGGRPAGRRGRPGPSPPTSWQRLVEDGTMVVDGRPRHDFAAGHIPGSVNIELDAAFGTYVGWLFPFGTPLALSLGPDQLGHRGAAPMRPNRDRDRSSACSTAAPRPGPHRAARSAPTRPPTSKACEAAMAAGGVRVLDVRQPLEWSDGRVPGALHIHVADLPARVDELQGSDAPVYIYCRTGHRTAMAASLLARAGIPPVLVDGGFPDWLALGLPVERDSNAPGHRRPFRLGRCGDGVGRPRRRGPSADRADRARPAGGTDSLRGPAARCRGHGCAGRQGAGVRRSGDVGGARRTRGRAARPGRLDLAPGLAAGLPRRHRRPTSRAL